MIMRHDDHAMIMMMVMTSMIMIITMIVTKVMTMIFILCHLLNFHSLASPEAKKLLKDHSQRPKNEIKAQKRSSKLNK